jgi:hypothetical protein
MADENDEIPNLDDIDQTQAQQMLQDFCENGFDGLTDMAALALGRDETSIQAMLEGSEEIDEDLMAKMLGIAQERGISIGEASKHAAG